MWGIREGFAMQSTQGGGPAAGPPPGNGVEVMNGLAGRMCLPHDEGTSFCAQDFQNGRKRRFVDSHTPMQEEGLSRFVSPKYEEDIVSRSCSVEGSASSRGSWRLNGNGLHELEAERPAEISAKITLKRKRVHLEADAGCNGLDRDDADSNDEDAVGEHVITEEYYRNMLEEHALKRRKACLKEAILSRTILVCAQKSGDVEVHKAGFHTEQIKRSLAMSPGEQFRLSAESESTGSLKDADGLVYVLDIGGVKYQIPPLYDQLASALRLPDYALVHIEERVFSGRIKSRAMVSAVASDKSAKLWSARTGMGDSHGGLQRPESVSYGERNARDGQNSFPLQVVDDPDMRLASRDAFGSALDGHQSLTSTLRHIASDGGLLRHCEVKVWEKGDGYELIERKVAKKEPVKIDPTLVAKEDAERFSRAWAAIVRKDLSKHHKAFLAFNKKQLQDSKRVSEACQREVKVRNSRISRVVKAAPIRIRRLCRDTVLHWKRVDKEQVEIRKREERDAVEAMKRDEEMREARRQQQRLNFLLTQTELYSHFMQDKMAGAATPKGTESSPVATGHFSTVGMPHGPLTAAEAAEEEALKNDALRAAENAALQQRQRTNAFDSESSMLRVVTGIEDGEQGTMQLEGAEDINLLHPSTMPTTSSVQQPKLFHGNLKDYQLKGLQWLVNCYEQGLNGILADEMGLGKTIQAMAFLAHLAEEKNIWGPFLVVAPASVLNNWADEVGRFCPDFKILPYWGGLSERMILRKNINPKRLYRRDASFHILITSYQLLVQDEKYFRRVKWQYMVLDEAQAIKSATSQRWKILLSFNCRNRLLLTGTPIQNNMAELWALLHFIMPTLFDSHEQFNEWFSKGIEGHAEHGGTLNEHQLSRLHSILKPFMLRRVKKDVITEMTNKKEVVLHCELSSRQQAFYQAIKNKISVAELLGGQLNDKKVLNLMNIVIQLRKVCNHPELFERIEGRSFVHFGTMYDPLLPPPFGEMDEIHYAGGRNPISYQVPKVLYRDGMRCLPTSSSGSAQGFQEKCLRSIFSIFSPQNVHFSVFPKVVEPSLPFSGTFGFTRLVDLSPSEVSLLAQASILEQWLLSISRDESLMLAQIDSEGPDYFTTDTEPEVDAKTRAVQRLLMVPPRSAAPVFYKKLATGSEPEPFKSLVTSYYNRYLYNVGLLRSLQKYMPPVRAPQIDLNCSDRGFIIQRDSELHNVWLKHWLVGLGRVSDSDVPVMPPTSHGLIQEIETKVKENVQQPLLMLPYRIFGSAPPVQSFDFAKMLSDSGKLKTLDSLLKRLRAGNHRVLVFAQMTKMLNLLEDYMNFRKYKYLRLDGSSSIMDRRDMVKDFQLRSDIFVFLLSTRAGGLGINLTAADVVIFYESDWNPTMDLQAMDRAHRLGQTKEVTVYRLICKGTVEEKIMQRASQKNTVQQLVMTGGQSQGDVFEAEEVVSLLLDDAELEQKVKEQVSKQMGKQDKRKKGWGVASGIKGVRLDDDGGALVDEDKIAPMRNVDAGSPQSIPPNGAVDAPAENGAAANKKRRRNPEEGKPPRPPRKPKVEKPPKEPKPAKPPKAKPAKPAQRRPSARSKAGDKQGVQLATSSSQQDLAATDLQGREPCQLGDLDAKEENEGGSTDLVGSAGSQKGKQAASTAAGVGDQQTMSEAPGKSAAAKPRGKVKLVIGKGAKNSRAAAAR